MITPLEEASPRLDVSYEDGNEQDDSQSQTQHYYMQISSSGQERKQTRTTSLQEIKQKMLMSFGEHVRGKSARSMKTRKLAWTAGARKHRMVIRGITMAKGLSIRLRTRITRFICGLLDKPYTNCARCTALHSIHSGSKSHRLGRLGSFA